MYLVKSGRVAIAVGANVVEVVGPGGTFGEMAVVDQSPRTARAGALEECELLAIDRAALIEVVKQQPAFAMATAARHGRTAAAHELAAGTLALAAARLAPRARRAQLSPSRKLRSFSERDGWRSFRSAFASIWRMRSRVTSNCLPTSSSVWSVFISMPKRMRSTFASRGVSESSTSLVASRRLA